MRPPFRHRFRRGATLLETLLAIGLLAVISTGFSVLVSDYSERQKAGIVAERLTTVGDAARRYMQRNSVALLAAVGPGTTPVRIPVAKVRAGDPVPAGISAVLPSLQGGGFLPSSFVDTNSYGQSHALIVRRVPGTDRIEGVVTTRDGRAIPDSVLGDIAAAAGQTAGFVPSNPVGGAKGRITGTAGGWAAVASDWQVAGIGPSAGHAVTTIALAEGAVVSDYLHRRSIGIAEANRMATNFSLGRNLVKDAPLLSNGATSVALGTDRVSVNTDLEVAQDLSAKKVVAQGEARSPIFTDGDDRNYRMDPASKSKFFDLSSEAVDTDSVAYGTSLGLTKAAATRMLGGYLRHDLTVVKRTGNYGDGQEMVEAYCPATHIRIGCAGGRSDPLLDTCDESECGFVGAMPVDSGSRQGCQVVIDGQQYTQPTVQAFCLSNVEKTGPGADAPVVQPPVVDEPGQQCPAWAPGVWPKCKLPPECPPWAQGDYPTCVLPDPGPQCPPWAPGSYPKCVVSICPPWLPGDFPYCGTQPVFDLYSVTCTSNIGRTQTIVGEGVDSVVTARAPSNGGTWVMKLGGPYVNCNDGVYNGHDAHIGHDLCRKFMPSSARPYEFTYLQNCSWRRLR